MAVMGAATMDKEGSEGMEDLGATVATAATADMEAVMVMGGIQAAMGMAAAMNTAAMMMTAAVVLAEAMATIMEEDMAVVLVNLSVCLRLVAAWDHRCLASNTVALWGAYLTDTDKGGCFLSGGIDLVYDSEVGGDSEGTAADLLSAMDGDKCHLVPLVVVTPVRTWTRTNVMRTGLTKTTVSCIMVVGF